MYKERNHIEFVLEDFIRTQFEGEHDGFTRDSNLFEDGYVDSINLEAFFSFIESRFDVLFREELFFDERITTVSGIADIIVELKA